MGRASGFRGNMRAGFASLLCLCALSVSAAGTHEMAVSATILSKSVCKFTDSGPTALDFGTIDPSVASVRTAAASTTFRCTGSNATATYAITSNDGLYAAGPNQPRMRHSALAAEFVSYSLNFPQAGSAPKNVVQTLSISGSIQPADFQNARAGAYADTVTLTIEP